MKNHIFSCLLILFSSNVLSAVATVTSPTSSAVGTMTSTLGGNVTNDGAEIILERGIVYAVSSVNANPQLGGVGVTSSVSYNLVTLSPAPANMMNYGANSGQVYRMSLTGSTSGGTVWGTGTYTDDSNLQMAAVHAGVLANGATGNVHIKVTAGSSSYTGSTSNGVTSLIYGVWPRNYEFVSSGPTGVFTQSVTGLTPNTTYAYVAYVTNASGTTYSSVSTFTTNSLAPTVSAIAPSTGSTLGGTVVTITGTDLTGATAITVGGAACTNVIVASATSATCTTPAGSAGTASVLVTTPGGTNAANTLFTYVAVPIVTSITPTNGITAGGTSITITGTNLTDATAITVGGVACTAFAVTNSTTATCTTPTGSAGTASVLVTTPGGTNAANTLFTYETPVAAPIPTLSEWAMIFLASLMGLFAFARIRRQS